MSYALLKEGHESSGVKWIRMCETTTRWEAAVLVHRHGNQADKQLSWETEPAAKPGDPTSIPRTHTVKERTDCHMQANGAHASSSQEING